MTTIADVMTRGRAAREELQKLDDAISVLVEDAGGHTDAHLAFDHIALRDVTRDLRRLRNYMEERRARAAA